MYSLNTMMAVAANRLLALKVRGANKRAARRMAAMAYSSMSPYSLYIFRGVRPLPGTKNTGMASVKPKYTVWTATKSKTTSALSMGNKREGPVRCQGMKATASKPNAHSRRASNQKKMLLSDDPGVMNTG